MTKGAAPTAAYQRDYRARRKAEGRAVTHKTETAAYWRARRYGLTEDQYQAMLVAQSNGCAICRTSFAGGVKVCVDHCHDSSVVRGLLCNDCNMALGRFKDDPDNLRRALAYLLQPVAKSSP